jgi:predicted ester cyclase
MSKDAEALRLVLEQGFGQGDLQVADLYAGEVIVEHEYGAMAGVSGADLLKSQIAEARGAMPDLVMTVEDMVVDSDKVWARSVGRGTHAATGAPVVLTVFDVCRFEGGRIVEHWGVPDRFALLHQAGLLAGAPEGSSG